MVSQKKLVQVQNIVSHLQKNKNFSLVKFEKTSHQSLEKLRRELKKNNSSIKVIKNSLLEKALKKIGQSDKLVSEFTKKFFPQKENTALLSLSRDWNLPLASFYKFAQNEKTLIFKCGLVDGVIYSTDQLIRLAQLPGKNELIGKVVAALKNPIYRLVAGLKWPAQKFVLLLANKSNLSN